MNGQVIIPFLLTLIAGLSTVIGSLIFLSNKLCQKSFLGFFLGLSAGAMISVSFLELMISSIHAVGFLSANLFFFLGIGFLALLDFLIPHNYLEEKICAKSVIVDTKLLSTGITVSITSNEEINRFRIYQKNLKRYFDKGYSINLINGDYAITTSYQAMAGAGGRVFMTYSVANNKTYLIRTAYLTNHSVYKHFLKSFRPL